MKDAFGAGTRVRSYPTIYPSSEDGLMSDEPQPGAIVQMQREAKKNFKSLLYVKEKVLRDIAPRLSKPLKTIDLSFLLVVWLSCDSPR